MTSDLLASFSAALDIEIRDVLDFHLPPLDDYARILYYHLGWIDEGQPPFIPGKRARPNLTLLCTAAGEGDWRQALPLAATVELLHNFSLIHDDIQDNSPLRRGRATVWKLWGVSQAINSGDALFNYAQLALDRAHRRELKLDIILEAFQLIHVTCYQLTRGQHSDLSFEQRTDVTVEDYLAMIDGKTASLIATSTELGALAAEVSPECRKYYRAFGYHLGLAYQIRDDLLGIWGEATATGKSSSTDIVTRKKTLPVIYGLQNSSLFRTLYRLEAHGGGRAEQIVTELEKCGAKEYAIAKEKHHADLALSSLDLAKPYGEAGQLLHEMTRQLLGRKT